jgi:hypothetical protein
MKHTSDLMLGFSGLFRYLISMTDGNQQQKYDHKTPSTKEIEKNKAVSSRFKNGQCRPTENQQSQTSDEHVQIGLSKKRFELLHDSSSCS